MEYKVIRHNGKHAGMKMSVFTGNGLAIFLPTLNLMFDVNRGYLCFSFWKGRIELGQDPLKIRFG
jgi:hypothetical protein